MPSVITLLGWVFVLAVIGLLTTYVALTIYNYCDQNERHRWRCFYVTGYHELTQRNPEPGFKIIDRINHDMDCNHIVSMSLYGDGKKYFDNIEKVIQLVQSNLDDAWQVRVYLHTDVPKKWKNKLVNAGHQVFVVHDPVAKPGNSAGAFWRWMPMCENGMTFLVLDVDYLVEADYFKHVEQWLNNADKRPFFKYTVTGGDLIPGRFFPPEHMLAGSCGRAASKHTLRPAQITDYPHRSTYGSDEVMLMDLVVPLAMNAGMYTGYRSKTQKFMGNLRLWKSQMWTKGSSKNEEEEEEEVEDKHVVAIINPERAASAKTLLPSTHTVTTPENIAQ